MLGRSVADCAADQRVRDYAAGFAAMNNYDNPYRDDPELAPLTRAGRLMECAFAVVLAFLAVYLSK